MGVKTSIKFPSLPDLTDIFPPGDINLFDEKLYYEIGLDL
jgi:hypothetical protein